MRRGSAGGAGGAALEEDAFVGAVWSTVLDLVSTGAQGLQQSAAAQLERDARARGGGGKAATLQRAEEQQRLAQGCARLTDALHAIYEEELSRFEQYARQNVFVMPTKRRRTEGGEKGEADGAEGDQGEEEGAAPGTREARKVMEQNRDLRASIRRLKCEGDAIEAETSANRALLNTLQGGIFNLHVSAQALDGAVPGSDASNTHSDNELASNYAKLERLVEDAGATTRRLHTEMDPSQGREGDSGGASSVAEVDAVADALS